jgi:hypothetical protein
VSAADRHGITVDITLYKELSFSHVDRTLPRRFSLPLLRSSVYHPEPYAWPSLALIKQENRAESKIGKGGARERLF